LTGARLKQKNGGILENESESLEHIIPNALGGRLKSKDILSHYANQHLNETVDKKFVKIFEAFCLRLELGRDRPATPSMRGKHSHYGVDVIFKNNRFYPTKPVFDEQNMVIYADSEKTGHNYRTHLLAKGKIAAADAVRVFDDMAGSIELKFELDNKVFNQGFAKIAVGFATLKGVAREYLRSAVDIEKNRLREDIILIPSVPKSHIEQEFELQVRKGSHYPVHGLVLYGSRKDRLLYCHVELFSAFQWHVILDDNYEGEDIFHSYIHQLSMDSEITLNEYLCSVLSEESGRALAPCYKRITKNDAVNLRTRHIIGSDMMRKYTYFKFNSLCAFSNMIYLRRKMAILGL